MSNELSELQAVDFALGKFIADAFTCLNDQRGPKEYREFLGRAVNRKIFRHDADTPAEFLKAYRSAQAGEKTIAGAKVNQVELPLVYYYRKPGLTNGADREKTRRGRYSFSGDLKNAYKFMVLPIVFDYKLFILSWDKPTLDSLQLAWYAYQERHDKFTSTYKIGDTDLFEVNAYLLDHKSLLCADASIAPRQDMSRVYAVSMGLQVATDVLYGDAVSVPAEYNIVGGLASSLPTKFTIGTGDGTQIDFSFDTLQLYGRNIPITEGSLKIYVNGVLSSTDLIGMDYEKGSGGVRFIDPPSGGSVIVVSFVENSGSSVIIAGGCPTCHKYGCEL
jgi:hypothetical protein